MNEKKMTIPEMIQYAEEHNVMVQQAKVNGWTEDDIRKGIALAILDTLSFEAGNIALN